MKASLVAAALVLSTVSSIHAQEDDEERQFVISQFRGWTGIVLHCVPNEANADVRDAICQSASAEFNYLADNSDIPHRVSDGEDMFQMTVNSCSLGTPLTLALDISATSSRNGPIGVHVRVAAEKFYTTAVEQGAKPGEPEASPRGGDLVFWERTTIGAGFGDQQVARDISPYVNYIIKIFFSHFLKGWKSK